MAVTPAPFSEELIVRYLLGELPEAESAELEDRAFQDSDCLQSILEVENDLIDEYVRGNISDDKRNEFETHFLASDVRRRKVEFARALATVASEDSAPQIEQTKPVPGLKVAPTTSFLALIRGLSPVSAFAYAAIALVFVAGAAWLVRDSIRLRSEVNELRAARQLQDAQRRQLEEQLAAERARLNGLNPTSEQPKKDEFARAPQPELPPAVAPPKQPAVLALALLPGLARSGGAAPKLQVASELRTVRLSVGIDLGDDYPSYRVELRAPGGERAWSRENVAAQILGGRRNLSLNLPANILKPGRYELAVQGINKGAREDLGYYYFEVLKK